MTNDEVIKKHNNLVYSVAISRHRQDLFDDLLQEGFIALCRANKLYKRQHKKNAAKFMTYARVGIYRAMNKFIENSLKHNTEDIVDHFELRDKHIIGKELESVSETKQLLTYVNKLPIRIIPIIIGLYGLKGECKTRGELCKEMNISRERLSQLINKGLRELREMLRRKYAKNYHNWSCSSKKFRKANNTRAWKNFNNKFKGNPSLRKRLCKASGRD